MGSLPCARILAIWVHTTATAQSLNLGGTRTKKSFLAETFNHHTLNLARKQPQKFFCAQNLSTLIKQIGVFRSPKHKERKLEQIGRKRGNWNRSEQIGVTISADPKLGAPTKSSENLTPKSSPHSSPRANKFATWTSLWGRSHIKSPAIRSRCCPNVAFPVELLFGCLPLGHLCLTYTPQIKQLLELGQALLLITSLIFSGISAL